jgi:hypothetical protein
MIKNYHYFHFSVALLVAAWSHLQQKVAEKSDILTVHYAISGFFVILALMGFFELLKKPKPPTVGIVVIGERTRKKKISGTNYWFYGLAMIGVPNFRCHIGL